MKIDILKLFKFCNTYKIFKKIYRDKILFGSYVHEQSLEKIMFPDIKGYIILATNEDINTAEEEIKKTITNFGIENPKIFDLDLDEEFFTKKSLRKLKKVFEDLYYDNFYIAIDSDIFDLYMNDDFKSLKSLIELRKLKI